MGFSNNGMADLIFDWKLEFQKLADETGLSISVCQFAHLLTSLRDPLNQSSIRPRTPTQNKLRFQSVVLLAASLMGGAVSK